MRATVCKPSLAYFWKRFILGLIVCCVALCACYGQDIRDVLFSRSSNVNDCLVNIGVTFAEDPVRSLERNRVQCATRCREDDGCAKFLFCSHMEHNCFRVKVFGLHSTESTRQYCDCYLRTQPLPCKNGGVQEDLGSCRCLHGFYGVKCENVITDCEDGHDRGGGILSSTQFGFAYIQPRGSSVPFPVYCLNFWGGYTYLQLRKETGSETDFNRSWQEYREGFGDLSGDFWMGLEQIHAITGTQRFCDVAVMGPDEFLITVYYSSFAVSDAASDYRITTGTFNPRQSNPNAVDSFSAPNQQNIDGETFKTYDHNPSGSSCPAYMRCGWWFAPGCTAANLNGPALTEEQYNNNPSQPRITWINMGYIKYAHMRVTSI